VYIAGDLFHHMDTNDRVSFHLQGAFLANAQSTVSICRAERLQMTIAHTGAKTKL